MVADEQRLRRRVDGARERLRALPDEGLRGVVDDLRRRARSGEAIDDLLPATFAVAGEAASRALGTGPTGVQVRAAAGIHRGALVELTGAQGTTLAAALAAVLASLPGDGVHVIALDDDLATRAAESMAPLYALLGVPCAVVLADTPRADRRAAYAADVTYVGVRAVILHRLYDGLRLPPARPAQRDLAVAIVDDADLVLGESRVPWTVVRTRPERRHVVAHTTARGHFRSYRRVGGLAGAPAENGVIIRRRFGLGRALVVDRGPRRETVRQHRSRRAVLDGVTRQVVRLSSAGRPTMVITPAAHAADLTTRLRAEGVVPVMLDVGTADRDEARRVFGRAATPGTVTVLVGGDGKLAVARSVSLRGVELPLGGAGADAATRDRVACVGGMAVVVVDALSATTFDLAWAAAHAVTDGRPGSVHHHLWLESVRLADAASTIVPVILANAVLNGAPQVVRVLRRLGAEASDRWWERRPWTMWDLYDAVDEVLDDQQRTIGSLRTAVVDLPDDAVDGFVTGLAHGAAARLVGERSIGDAALAERVAAVGVPPPATWPSAGPAGLRAVVAGAALRAYAARRAAWPDGDPAATARRLVCLGIDDGWPRHLDAYVEEPDRVARRLYDAAPATVAAGEAGALGEFRAAAGAAFADLLAGLPVAALRSLLTGPPAGGHGGGGRAGPADHSPTDH